jgi:ferritin-like metal-binding protein YciE
MTEVTATQRVADLFTETAYSEEMREIIREDLASMSAEELVEGFREAEQVTQGLLVMGEALGIATYTLLSDAARRLGEALRRAEALRQGT